MHLADLNLHLLFLCFMRVSGFTFTAPLFGSRLVPVLVRVWFSLLFAMAILPVVKAGGQLPAFADAAYFILVAKELLVGVMIGFVSTFFIYAAEFSGHVLGLQMGFAASTLFDPFSKGDVAVVGRFQGLLAIVLFLVMNGHHVLLTGFASSYESVPVAMGGLGAAAGGHLINATANVFTLAVKIAIPVLSAIFLVQVGIALLAKTVPQMNVFVVGFPLKIAVGLTVLGFSLPYFSYVLAKAITGVNADLRSVMTAAGG
jgi:flagellar biosynthetic protein FliR